MPETAPPAKKPQQIVLIGGAMRSGTTAIHRALCTAQNSNPYIAESWFLHGIMDLFRSSLSRYDLGLADQFGDRKNFIELMKFNIQYYFNIVSAKYGDPDVLIFKHPALTRHFIEIGEMFPQVRFLVVVRDPRDVIASMKEVSEKHRQDGIASLHSNLTTTADFCGQYGSYYGALLRNPGKLANRLTFVRYEDVMSAPQESIAKIGAIFGANYVAGDIAQFNEQHASSSYLNKDERLKDPFSRAFWSDMYTKELSSEKIGRYRASLAPAEIEEIESRLGAIGKQFRYWS